MKAFRNEEWKLLTDEKYDAEKEKILISNYGRVKREIATNEFKEKKLTTLNGFKTFSHPKKGKKSPSSFYVHKAVAAVFLKKPEGAKFVIHKDHDLTNNHVSNLQWVTQKELTNHQLTNPKRIAKFGIKPTAKLSEAKVRVIKKKLLDPNRRTRLRIIASQFGITTTQLYRIKSGENWGEIKV